MTCVLVTGANGFVGAALCRALEAAGYAVRRAVRRAPSGHTAPVHEVGEVHGETDWRAALDGAEAVVHLVARTHVVRDAADAPLEEFRRVNVAGTRALARQAAAAGAVRMIYVSSIKVNGERTVDCPYTEADEPRPEDAYGVTKREAEQALAQIAAETGLETVVLRPPLVYGAGVKGNFRRLLDLVARGVPLPLASIENRRSLIYVENLADAIRASIAARGAAGRTYLVSDGEDVSTPGLVRALAQELGVKARLFGCPPALLAAAAAALGRRDEVGRLTGSLQVDRTLIERELSWRPPHTLASGLAETTRWYRALASIEPSQCA